MRRLQRLVPTHTELVRPACLPELSLRLITPATSTYHVTDTSALPFPDPFWGFLWPGGYAMARLVLERPELVRGRSVLDFGAGSGVVALAALRAGAKAATANDIDEWACAAALVNAADNGLPLEAEARDLVGGSVPISQDVVLAGDVCYDFEFAARAVGWLRSLAAADPGRDVLIGDPGRAYLPEDGLELVYSVPMPEALGQESPGFRECRVYRVLPSWGWGGAGGV